MFELTGIPALRGETALLVIDTIEHRPTSTICWHTPNNSRDNQPTATIGSTSPLERARSTGSMVRSADTLIDMTAVYTYTLIVDGTPFSYTAESAPSIGELVRLDADAVTVRVAMSVDGGRIYVGEPADKGES